MSVSRTPRTTAVDVPQAAELARCWHDRRPGAQLRHTARGTTQNKVLPNNLGKRQHDANPQTQTQMQAVPAMRGKDQGERGSNVRRATAVAPPEVRPPDADLNLNSQPPSPLDLSLEMAAVRRV